MPDDELLAIAVGEEFVFVTNNHTDFIGLRGRQLTLSPNRDYQSLTQP
jgi:hypothetical protein